MYLTSNSKMLMPMYVYMYANCGLHNSLPIMQTVCTLYCKPTVKLTGVLVT